MSEFDVLIKELSETIGIELAPDANDSCVLKYKKSGIVVQLEIDRQRDYFIMGIELGAVPPGRYREELFEAALKTNGGPYPRNGNLAFSTKSEQLVLCHELGLKGLRGFQIAEALTPMIEKAERWRDSLAKSVIPIPEGLELPPGARYRETPFGLRP